MIRLSKSSISQQEIDAVTAVLKAEYLGLGPGVQQFEQRLTEFFQADCYVVCTNTGTAALQLALQALSICDQDEVLVPSLTYLASFQAISASGAIPIACDVNLADGLIDLNDAKRRITAKTKAIMPVHYAGNVGHLAQLYDFAKQHHLRIIEDAAHAFGTTYAGQLIGTIGDVVCFSFDGIKNITSGEGGAVVTKDKAIAEKIKDLRLLGVIKDSDQRYGRQRSWDFDVVEQGWRYHMSDIMAAIGQVQLQRFPTFKAKRQLLHRTYRNLLASIPNVTLLEVNPDCDVVPHIMPIRVLNQKRDSLRQFLLEHKIEVGIHYKPNHLLTKYRSAGVGSLPNVEQLYQELLTLPLHADLTEENVVFICKQVENFMRDH